MNAPRTILLTIHAGEKTCNGCELLDEHGDHVSYCRWLGKDLKVVGSDEYGLDVCERPQQCIAAEPTTLPIVLPTSISVSSCPCVLCPSCMQPMTEVNDLDPKVSTTGKGYRCYHCVQGVK